MIERSGKIGLKLKLAAAGCGLFLVGGATSAGYFAYEGQRHQTEADRNVNRITDMNAFWGAVGGTVVFGTGVVMLPATAIAISRRRGETTLSGPETGSPE